MKITIELDTDTLTPEQLTAVGMLIPSPFDRKPLKIDPPAEEKPKTIKRVDVRLKVGDRVTLRGLIGTQTVSERNDGTSYKIAAGPFTLTEVGTHSHIGPHNHPADIISVNGIQIED
jgi:hypothetical protein